MHNTNLRLLAGAVALAATAALALADSSAEPANKITVIASTVPANGDINPYGIAKVKATVGNLTKGHFLVSNFNNAANQQGTGTTIMDIAPNGTVKLFAQVNPASLPGPCPGGVGLTTALAVLRPGWVIVGSLPTTDGTSATAQAGCLLVLNSSGTVVSTIVDPLINGPWDMDSFEGPNKASLFVSNVLNSTVSGNGQIVNEGSVVRVDLNLSGLTPAVTDMVEIGFGFPERTDPAALVIGPTGLAFGEGGILYVADTLNNRIASISGALARQTSAGVGRTVAQGKGLNAPLGMALVNDILTVNANNGFLVRTGTAGGHDGRILLDKTGTPPGAGTLFGLTVTPAGVYFVDDGSNTLRLLHVGQ